MNALTLRHAHTVPAILANAGENAATKFLEFFAARIRNLNTREAYARACAQFLAWSERHVDDIRLITPMHVAAYIEQHPGSPQTIKQHLAAIKMLFDYLVISQIVPVNPAAPVKGPTHVVKRGKTPVLSVEDARTRFHSDRFSAGFAGPGLDRRHALFFCAGFGRPWDEGVGFLRKRTPALVPVA
jgi:site-specific recombinase XerD